jgi:UDP-2,3-diacylglucosamine pyrophosphatase LpxH
MIAATGLMAGFKRPTCLRLLTDLLRPYFYTGDTASIAPRPSIGHTDSTLRTPMPAPPRDGRSYRSIFISDIHLGTRGCRADFLLDFLARTESEHLFIVGDLVDGWRLKRSWYWTQTHNDVIQRLLAKVRAGTAVTYIPGNHDEALRHYCGMSLGGVAVRKQAEHAMADGRRFLILHGDEFDGVIRHCKWLAFAGDWAYGTALKLNQLFNDARRLLGLPYWSLSAYLKNKVKNAVEYISRFENMVAAEARRRNADGVICGHIHHAEIRDIDGITYCNDGDWVESCTALVEHRDGTLEIIRWAEIGHRELSLAPVTRARAVAPAAS